MSWVCQSNPSNWPQLGGARTRRDYPASLSNKIFSEVFVWISLVLVFLCPLTMVLIMIILWLIIGGRLGLSGSFFSIMYSWMLYLSAFPQVDFSYIDICSFFVNDFKCIWVAVFLWFSSVRKQFIDTMDECWKLAGEPLVSDWVIFYIHFALKNALNLLRLVF